MKRHFKKQIMKETTFQKIMRKTGKKSISCKCELCKMQCRTPCKGTPEDMEAIIKAGFDDRIMLTECLGVKLFTPRYDREKKSCTFFTNGLCELHDLGLKPTEGKLSHHSTTAENFNINKSLTKAILKEWA